MREESVKNSKEIVKELVSKYIPERPSKITLKLDWYNKKSLVNLKGENLNETIEYPRSIDFIYFAHGVIDAYRDAYGALEVVPISFREEIYKNERVSLDLYPTGSTGIFDIFIEYKEK